MNKRFQTLPEEKQLAIMRAATEVFAKYEYKKASTDLIASKAGVSKGLLFYYFHNKRDLYLTVYEYVEQIITKEAKAFAKDFDGVCTGSSVTVAAKQGLEEIFMDYYGGDRHA